MGIKISKEPRRKKIKARVRKKISGTNSRPRMTVYRSNKDIYIQLVDDKTGTTLLSASSKQEEISSQKITKTEKAKLVGKSVAEKAKEAGIDSVVFDRNGYIYHGRIKALADAAREGGIKF